MKGQHIMKNGQQKLRFAALIRVSTERQEKTGESLLTQRNDIIRAVEEMGSTIVEWYGGQEHATPGFEKQEVDRLLRDARKQPRLFDAVMVTHADRWSRDNTKSTAGRDILKGHDVRFFVGRNEQDLFDPQCCFNLGISAVVGQYYAEEQAKKSIHNRINRARRGFPTSGKLPYGRTFDKEKGWGIDESKRSLIREVAKRYIAGESMAALGREFDSHTGRLHWIISQRSGSVWMQTFKSPRYKINEQVPTKIPALLDDEMIRKFRARAEGNRTFLHGPLKQNRYLLSHVMFCAHCGYAMSGCRTPAGRFIYRHTSDIGKLKHKCPSPHGRSWIDAELLESKVIAQLFETFGNPVAVQRAIEAATPNLERVKETRARIERIEDALRKIEVGRNRILNLVAKGSVTEAQAAKQLTGMSKDEAEHQSELVRLNGSVASVAAPAAIKAASQRFARRFRERRYVDARLTIKIRRANHLLDRMTWVEKRALVEMVFGGKTPDGKRMGVYVEWRPENRPRHPRWRYVLHGHLLDDEGEIGSLNTTPLYETEGGGSLQRELLRTATKYALS